MSHNLVRFTYPGGSPTGANTVTVFNSVTAFSMANNFQLCGIRRLLISMKHDQALTLKAYRSSDRGANWVQIGDTGSLASTGATDDRMVDYLVEGYPDFKVELLNGGVNQGAGFYCDVSGAEERSPAV